MGASRRACTSLCKGARKGNCCQGSTRPARCLKGIIMKKVELLSPAGSYQALAGAISAGADAVYLGGEQYGARAYADNFSTEEIIRGIHFAHVFGKKIYLTVNTLVKEKELDPLYEFLMPFYENGLDGVIVQDLGALCFIRSHFPGLLLHASTQMTVTGWRGAELLMKEGVSRVVPARELSLAEIIEMKKRTGIEIEAFIHGAMCYCYSGQCLFSSLLGGRSGNRGRCAQPCRLPYQVERGQESYVLSMRDMCTLEILPELIRAGIDSFKIEGRMKKPEYAAGVTAVYRKYIDRYYEAVEADPANAGNCRVDKEDQKRLHSLYIRSNTGGGYYHRHNGKEMLTLGSPAYSETDEGLLKEIREAYIDRQVSVPVNAQITLEAEKEAVLTLEGGGETVTVKGAVVQTALKQPLSEEKVVNQIQKSGQSQLRIDQVQVKMAGDVFTPVGALNQLRREASAELEHALIRKNGLAYENRMAVSPQPFEKDRESFQAETRGSFPQAVVFHASVRTKEQLLAAVEQKIKRIYLDYSLLAGKGFDLSGEILKSAQDAGILFYAATPYITRAGNESHLQMIRQAVEEQALSGVLVRNLESYAFFEKYLSPEQMVLDGNLYIWNRESVRFWSGRVSEYYLPAECNAGEWRALLPYNGGSFPRQSVQVYGRLPMMVSANCVKKTTGDCRKASGILMMKDRYGKLFPVYHDCISCYNVIYNSVPLSLHELFRDASLKGASVKGTSPSGLYSSGMCPSQVFCRLDFTVEDQKESAEVMEYFKQLGSGQYAKPAYGEYTTGHLKRGVE